jgi:hypothetical protein
VVGPLASYLFSIHTCNYQLLLALIFYLYLIFYFIYLLLKLLFIIYKILKYNL